MISGQKARCDRMMWLLAQMLAKRHLEHLRLARSGKPVNDEPMRQAANDENLIDPQH